MSPCSPVSPSGAEGVQGVYADILSQAVTGEIIGALNYATLAPLCTGVDDQLDAIAHAASERRHVLAFRALARELGLQVIEDPSAPYWRRIREAFLRRAADGDALGCLMVQELMLESFAVALYAAVADAKQGRLSQVFRAVAEEEAQHLEHALPVLAAALARDPDAFEAQVERLHHEVMGVLAAMVATRDTDGHCGLCRGTCVKESLGQLGLSAPQLRGKALRTYLQSLDRVGVRGEKSLRWVAQLPV